MIAALFVESGGCYFGEPWSIDAWDAQRDARLYSGPHPVVAHPPCQRWGRYWKGSVRANTPRYELGADNGCFEAALRAVRTYGGVLEHPQDSHAWAHFGLAKPPRVGGWVKADDFGGWTCRVEQGFYGHLSCKATWLYACRIVRPELRWGSGPQRLHPVALARHGYAKARRIGMIGMIGGKDKVKIRNATPPEFKAILVAMARSCNIS